MGATHTEGPWLRDGLTVYAIGPRGGTRMSISVMPGPDEVSRHSDMDAMSTQLANAELIRSLPDMLRELGQLRAEVAVLKKESRQYTAVA